MEVNMSDYLRSKRFSKPETTLKEFYQTPISDNYGNVLMGPDLKCAPDKLPRQMPLADNLLLHLEVWASAYKAAMGWKYEDTVPVLGSMESPLKRDCDVLAARNVKSQRRPTLNK
jgi:hypothetical protein